MWRATGKAVLTLLLVALVGSALYEVVLGVSRGPGLTWVAVVEGALLGLAVLAVWVMCRDARAAGISLVALAALVAAGMNSPIAPLRGLAQAPLSWALLTALLVRLVTGAARPPTQKNGDR